MNIQERVTREFMKIVQIDSLSFHEEKMFEYLKQRLAGLPVTLREEAYTVEELGIRANNLIVTLPATAGGHAGLFFDSHVDTVPPGEGIRPILENGIVRSDGSTVLGSDDKAGVAAMLIAIEEIVASPFPHGELTFLFTSAEEVGLTGAKYLDFSKIHADYGFILDSHGSIGGIITAAPAHFDYMISVKGKASHAGIAPEDGISAIKIAAELVGLLPQGRINSDTVANVGLIEGGKALNIVPEECFVKGEFRSHNAKDLLKMKRRIEKAAAKIRGKAVSVDVEITEMYRGFSYAKDSPIVELARNAMETIGCVPRLEKTGGGSNTNIYNGKGIQALTLAVGMMDVHSTKEWVAVKDLEDMTRFIMKVCELA